MPVCTRSAIQRQLAHRTTPLRRSARIARAIWLQRLRPRSVACSKAPVKQHRHYMCKPGKRRRARLYAEPNTQLRRSARLFAKQQKSAEVTNLPQAKSEATNPPQAKSEVFIMTKNPLFSDSAEDVYIVSDEASAQSECWTYEPTPAAPRSCTGWNCVCAAPFGYGDNRVNYCRLYDVGPLPPPPISPNEPEGYIDALPMLRTALLPLMLASIGIPVIPSSPCISY